MDADYMQSVEQRAHALVNLKENLDAARDLCVGQHARKLKRASTQARKQVCLPASSMRPRAACVAMRCLVHEAQHARSMRSAGASYHSNRIAPPGPTDADAREARLARNPGVGFQQLPGEQQRVATPQVARGWARPPCRHFKTQSLAAALAPCRHFKTQSLAAALVPLSRWRSPT
jgi:hypothetical protein